MPPPKSTEPLPELTNKPRGKMTAYAFFVQICREEHKRRHPEENVNFADFSKKCADRWKTMSEKEKRRFNQMATEDKKRHELELKNADVTNKGIKRLTKEEVDNFRPEKKPRKKRKLKDPNAPKRSMSAFFWFSQEERPKVRAANPDFTVGEVAKELARRWSEVSPSMKDKYEALAEKDRERYDKDKKEYFNKKKAEAKPQPITEDIVDSDEGEDSD